MGQIVAIGGLSGLATENSRKIDHYLLELTGKERPAVCFIPTASAESRERVVDFYEAFSALRCEPSWLSLFNLPAVDLERFLLSKDLLFVGGGNTRSMLALWREWGVDELLRRAYARGAILAGSSAGANCWFAQCTTDSLPGDLTVLDCLGLLAGSFTPHYDVEGKRRPALRRFLAEGSIAPGFAGDNDTALHFVDGELRRALRFRDGAAAYRVRSEGEEFLEEPLEMTDL